MSAKRRPTAHATMVIIFHSQALLACARVATSTGEQCLLQRGGLTTQTVLSTASCAPLQLPGLDVGHCAGLAPGESCEVSCPSGQIGGSVRYFCFQSLADTGLPPAALLAPLCFPSDTSEYGQGAKMALRWVGTKGCLSCPNAWSECSTVEDAVDPSDARCTAFTLDLLAKRIRLGKWNMCVDMFSGPKPGLWGCSATSDDQDFEPVPSQPGTGSHDLCVASSRGRLCLTQMGLPRGFFETPPDVEAMRPALDALQAGDGQSFLQQSLATQACRARLESGLPDDFWLWLKSQPQELHQALFATFPVHPGQVRLFSAIVESFGRDKFEELGLASLAVATSWVNRGKAIDEAVRFPHPKFEQHGNTFLAGEEDRIRRAIIDEGRHCGLQSNECRNLNDDCCAGGAGHTNWTFKWPRDPSPSVREWLHWLVDQAVEHPEKLWADPREVPWTMGVYIFPSPIAECEWVHDKLIEEQAMEEARWYKYDSSFHTSVCEAGDPRFHPDSLPGIAVYGGVCGRMATLEARKSGCMGMPATTKGEPGHVAGFKFKSKAARWTALNVVTGIPQLSYLSLRPVVKNFSTLEFAVGSEAFPNVGARCLNCSRSWEPCEYAASGSEDCTQFELDTQSKLARRRGGGDQCLDVFSGPKPGMWRCASGANANQNFEINAAGELVIASGRGAPRFRATAVPPEPTDDLCLSCPGSQEECALGLMNSSACTKFLFDEDAKLIRQPSTGECIDMYGGPKPGTWSCANTSANQQTEVTEEGLLSITSSRGNLRFQRWPVVADVAEEERCLKCKAKNSACEFAAAGSRDCTLFGYDEEMSLIYNGDNGQCFHMRAGPLPASNACQSSWESQQATLDVSRNQLKLWVHRRGMLLLQKPGGGPLPSPSVRWAYQGFHELECPQSNCHYNSMLGLDSSQLFWSRHKESALASLESFNDYQTSGLWPTAHDEARLAASMAYSLKRAGADDALTEPLVAWALRRNGALYEAWELAAEYPAGGALDAAEQPSRSELASHRWRGALPASLLRLRSSVSAGHMAAADRFAKEHLLAGERWAAYPHLHQALIGTLCGVLSNATLDALGGAGEQCALLGALAKGLGWEEAEEDMLELEVGKGNGVSDAFQSHWAALGHITASGEQHERAEAMVERLLQQMSVGYINERSENFWATHRRVLLRGPYAHLLQLAGALLPRSRREALLNSTRAILQHPLEYPDRLLSDPRDMKDAFLEWLASHANAARHGLSGSAASDVVNGYVPDDGAGPEVMRQLQLDRDEEMELGARPLEEGSHPGSQSIGHFDVYAVLAALLNLSDVDNSSSGEFEAAEEQPTPGPTPVVALAGVRVSSRCSSWEWSEHTGKYSGGYAGGVSSGFGLEGAKKKCVDLGSACAAVTCSSGGTCTVRGSSTLKDSSSGEITYEKACNPEPVECSSWEWSEHTGKYSGGYAGGVSSGFGLEGAKKKCVDLGSACAAVTCSSGGTCTVRGSSTLKDSPSGEITYEKICNPDPTEAPAPAAPAPAPTTQPMSATQAELLQYCVADFLAR